MTTDTMRIDPERLSKMRFISDLILLLHPTMGQTNWKHEAISLAQMVKDLLDVGGYPSGEDHIQESAS